MQVVRVAGLGLEERRSLALQSYSVDMVNFLLSKWVVAVKERQIVC